MAPVYPGQSREDPDRRPEIIPAAAEILAVVASAGGYIRHSTLKGAVRVLDQDALAACVNVGYLDGYQPMRRDDRDPLYVLTDNGRRFV